MRCQSRRQAPDASTPWPALCGLALALMSRQTALHASVVARQGIIADPASCGRAAIFDALLPQILKTLAVRPARRGVSELSL
jgi:hypothetical protein